MRISRKFTQLATLWLALLMFSSVATAQSDTLRKRAMSKFQPQVGNISFLGPVHLDSLRKQDKIIVVNGKSPAREELTGYKIVSYTFTLVSAKGKISISIIGNSFKGVKGLLNDASPGSFVAITDLKCKKPDGSILTLNQLAAELK